MRTTPALIAELEEEGRKHFDVVMVVAFEDWSILIGAKDKGRLQSLNKAMKSGGEPIGLFIAKKSGGELNTSWRIYPEHAGETELCEAFMGQLAEHLGLRLA